jgi:hypothetical protein
MHPEIPSSTVMQHRKNAFHGPLSSVAGQPQALQYHERRNHRHGDMRTRLEGDSRPGMEMTIDRGGLLDPTARFRIVMAMTARHADHKSPPLEKTLTPGRSSRVEHPQPRALCLIG